MLTGKCAQRDFPYTIQQVTRLMHDLALALMAVQTQTTEILNEFPTKAAETEAKTAEV